MQALHRGLSWRSHARRNDVADAAFQCSEDRTFLETALE